MYANLIRTKSSQKLKDIVNDNISSVEVKEDYLI